jgi:membrane-bound metal-dependent hydrolase YbcI (DUF457 family)
MGRREVPCEEAPSARTAHGNRLEDMADNITHALAAALLAQAGLRQRYGAIATVALVVGSELPDLDSFSKFAGPVADFVHHRGITHSLVGGAGLALLGAVLLWSIWRRSHPYWRVTWLVYLGVLLHIWMDYVTSYGTQIFLPFDAGRYTSDTVFIVDLCYSGIMITGLLLVRMIRRQAQARYRSAGLLWVLLGLGMWLTAPHLGQPPWTHHTLASAGLALVLLAGLGRVALWLLGRLRQSGQAPYGTVGLVWLLFGVGLWLSAPRVVPASWVLMAQQEAGRSCMLFAAILVVLAWLSRPWQAPQAVVFGRLGVIALTAYVVLCFVTHAVAQRQMAHALGPQMAQVRRIAALPVAGGGPLHWRVIAETDSTYLVSRVAIFPATVTAPQVIVKGSDHKLVQALSQYRLVRIFWDFARFPVIECDEQETGTVVRYVDLRFKGDGRDRSWFDLIVRLDQAGQVQVIEFLNRIFHPTHPEFSALPSGS